MTVPPFGEEIPVTTDGKETGDLVQDAAVLALNGTALSVSFALGDLSSEVRIPPGILSQAMFDLLTNAADASMDHGCVHIEAQTNHSDGELILSVRDEGDGMDRDTLQRALVPYFSTKPGAAGMGLTVASAQLERFGARLEIETDPGYGTTARVRLPLVEATGPDPIDREIEVPAFHDLHVVLVGDDTLVLCAVTASLQAVGCHVIGFNNGDRAIEFARDRYRRDRRCRTAPAGSRGCCTNRSAWPRFSTQ